jgi:hypothetical protein
MADSENKTVHFQSKISCINTPIELYSVWSLILSIHIVRSDGKGSTKNKFELDRPDHDSHENRAERYLV